MAIHSFPCKPCVLADQTIILLKIIFVTSVWCSKNTERALRIFILSVKVYFIWHDQAFDKDRSGQLSVTSTCNIELALTSTEPRKFRIHYFTPTRRGSVPDMVFRKCPTMPLVGVVSPRRFLKLTMMRFETGSHGRKINRLFHYLSGTVIYIAYAHAHKHSHTHAYRVKKKKHLAPMKCANEKYEHSFVDTFLRNEMISY